MGCLGFESLKICTSKVMMSLTTDDLQGEPLKQMMLDTNAAFMKNLKNRLNCQTIRYIKHVTYIYIYKTL